MVALQACSINGRHQPAPLTSELHHLVPVAWQLFWQPATPPAPGRDPDGRGMLWDDRGVQLCPTHHRNVHALIVQMMRAVAQAKINIVPTITIARARRPELQIATLGLQRLLAVGGDLLALTAAGEWGEA